MIVGTAGHVDHGKTSLVRALTGVDTDRLAEEKSRGISIELGFAYAPTQRDGVDPIGFIDVPGHRRFVQTMIAGAAGIDLGLVVVAADDGPMPQTDEHLDILRWLGVTRFVVALTKVDVVPPDRVDEAAREVAALFASKQLAADAVVPCSPVDGRGVEHLRSLLEKARDDTVAHDADRGRFRLAIDRAFTLQGIGLVVTGTAFAGRVAIDDTVALLSDSDDALTARVRGIRAQDTTVASAHAGQRVALNLVGRGVEKAAVTRGMWAVDPALARVVDRIDVRLFAEQGGDALSSDWRAMRFHCAATASNARVGRLGSFDGTEFAQVVLERPLHAVVGDRFVLRDGSEGGIGTVAGGVVVDVDVPARGSGIDARLAFLAALAPLDARQALGHAVTIAATGIDLARWNASHNTRFAPGDVDARVVGDVGNERAILVSHERWAALRERVVATLAAEHARAPDSVGLGRDRLRRQAMSTQHAATFDALVDELRAEESIAQTGSWLHLPSHRVELSADDRARLTTMRPLIEATPFNPPRVRDLARVIGVDEAVVRGCCMRLAARGELYRVAHDHYFLPDAIRRLAAAAAEVATGADGVARAAAFRDRIVVGRKVAIQILEFFDRTGFTRRVGDEHRVVQAALFDG